MRVRIIPSEKIVYGHLNPILIEAIKYHIGNWQGLKMKQVIIWQCHE